MVEYKLLGSTPPAFSGRTGLLPPPGKRHAGLKQRWASRSSERLLPRRLKDRRLPTFPLTSSHLRRPCKIQSLTSLIQAILLHNIRLAYAVVWHAIRGHITFLSANIQFFKQTLIYRHSYPQERQICSPFSRDSSSSTCFGKDPTDPHQIFVVNAAIDPRTQTVLLYP